MKKLLILLIAVFIGGAPCSVHAEAAEYYFGKVTREGVFLYKDNTASSPIFEIPESYFVKLTGVKGEFYQASYYDEVGYIKKTEVTPVQGNPQSPYAVTSVQVFDPKGQDLYRLPSHQASDVLSTLPCGSESVTYYGRMSGASLPKNDTLWYYCKFNGDTSKGYLYYAFCNLETFSKSVEGFDAFPPITTPLFSSRQESSGLSDVAKTFIILGVSLPCALIIYLLIKPTLSTSETKPKKRRRRGDYFEFDENDLT